MNDKQYTLEEIKSIFPKTDFSWIQSVNFILKKLPKQWRFVGGCVRDSLLGIQTFDIDVNTLSSPEEIEKSMTGFNLNIIGKRFGTIGIFYKKWNIEITTTREDIVTYGRKADVQFITDFKTDSNRRDFTINALMLEKNIIYDYHNGVKDLQNKQIIFIGNAVKRIEEDYLRIMRYIRFLTRFGNISNYKNYEEVIINNLEGMKLLSKERIINEIYAMCKYPNTSNGIKILNELLISKTTLGNNLYEEISDQWHMDKKMAFIFINFNKLNWKKLPLPKKAKEFLLAYDCKYVDYKQNYSFIWNKFHCLKMANLFLDIYNILHKTNHIINVEDTFQCDYEILNNFIDTEKSKAMLAMRYLYLEKLVINFDNVKSLVGKL